MRMIKLNIVVCMLLLWGLVVACNAQVSDARLWNVVKLTTDFYPNTSVFEIINEQKGAARMLITERSIESDGMCSCGLSMPSAKVVNRYLYENSDTLFFQSLTRTDCALYKYEEKALLVRTSSNELLLRVVETNEHRPWRNDTSYIVYWMDSLKRIVSIGYSVQYPVFYRQYKYAYNEDGSIDRVYIEGAKEWGCIALQRSIDQVDLVWSFGDQLITGEYLLSGDTIKKSTVQAKSEMIRLYIYNEDGNLSYVSDSGGNLFEKYQYNDGRMMTAMKLQDHEEVKNAYYVSDRIDHEIISRHCGSIVRNYFYSKDKVRAESANFLPSDW